MIADVVTAVVVVALVAGLAVWTVRRARRSVARWRSRVLALRAAMLPPGPRRDATRLRRALREELQATAEMLTTVRDGQVFRADARALLTDLVAAAADVDRDLAAIERFADDAEQRRALAGVADQARRLIAASYSARHTVLQTAVEDRARSIDALTAQVAQQAAAVDLYRRSNSSSPV